jgi:glutamine amidotransferase-like uncharacterized protein
MPYPEEISDNFQGLRCGPGTAILPRFANKTVCMKKICIYSGSGASQQNARILKGVLETALRPHGFETVFVTETDIAARLARPDTVLVVFGGGEFTRVKAALGAVGVTAVQDYVRNGGRYFGSCMGGYAGARDIVFTGEGGERVNTGFGFFDGIARGSLPMAAPFDGQSASATVAPFCHSATGMMFPALYWGGPAFEGDQSLPVITCAHRGTVFNMAVSVPVGGLGGRAVLSGCHVEAITPGIVREWTGKFSSGDINDARLSQEIKRFAPGQYMVGLSAILDQLALVPHHSFLRQIMPASLPAGLRPAVA